MSHPLPDPSALTRRQREILELAAKGLTNPEISSVLGIATGTVKVHLAAVYRTLEVTNRTEAAVALTELERDEAGAPRTEVGQARALAVLPFDNLSADPEQDYFADGLVEELITRLSRWRWFPVIARQSTFAYRGKANDLVEVGRELGAAYLVEGSVRRGRDRVRVTAQLIDARSNHHVWAESFDRPLAGVFEIQDEISRAIAAALHPEVLQSEGERARTRPPEDFDAWELAMRGLALLERRERDARLDGLACCERALDADPESLIASFGLVMAHYQSLVFQWAKDPAAAVHAVREHAARCARIAPDDAYTHLAQGTAWMLAGEVVRATGSLRSAIERNPSSARAYSFLGQLVGMRGDPDEGIALLEEAIRLSPRDPGLFSMVASIGICHFGAGRLEEACAFIHRAAELRDSEPLVWSMLASASALAGRDEEARLALDELFRVQPSFSLEGFRQVAASVQPAYLERFEEGLRLAGFGDAAGG